MRTILIFLPFAALITALPTSSGNQKSRKIEKTEGELHRQRRQPSMVWHKATRIDRSRLPINMVDQTILQKALNWSALNRKKKFAKRKNSHMKRSTRSRKLGSRKRPVVGSHSSVRSS